MTDLRRRPLRDSGIDVPVVGVGCNNFGSRLDAVSTAAVVHAAIDAGIGFFDTADIYGSGRSEEFIGRALEGRRDRAIIATKFGGPMDSGERSGGSRRWVTEAVEDSLRRLRTDRIDLYQHHFPDDETELDETMAALDDLVRAGKVRAIGCSNYDSPRIAASERLASEHGWSHFVTAQNQYSLLARREVEEDVAPACARFGIGILPYFPLQSGMLTGKYRRGADPPPGTRLAGNPQRAADLFTDATFTVVERLETFAYERGVELLDIAIGALAAQSQVVSVIAGATSAAQVVANARAGQWIPSPGDLAEIDSITAGIAA